LKFVDKPQDIKGKLHCSLFQLFALNAHGAMFERTTHANPSQSNNQITN